MRGAGPADERRAIEAGVCVCLVGAVDRPLKRAGEAGRVAVFDAVEDDLVPLHEVIDVHVQMRRAWMAGELPRQLRIHIA